MNNKLETQCLQNIFEILRNLNLFRFSYDNDQSKINLVKLKILYYMEEIIDNILNSDEELQSSLQEKETNQKDLYRAYLYFKELEKSKTKFTDNNDSKQSSHLNKNPDFFNFLGKFSRNSKSYPNEYYQCMMNKYRRLFKIENEIVKSNFSSKLIAEIIIVFEAEKDLNFLISNESVLKELCTEHNNNINPLKFLLIAKRKSEEKLEESNNNCSSSSSNPSHMFGHNSNHLSKDFYEPLTQNETKGYSSTYLFDNKYSVVSYTDPTQSNSSQPSKKNDESEKTETIDSLFDFEKKFMDLDDQKEVDLLFKKVDLSLNRALNNRNYKVEKSDFFDPDESKKLLDIKKYNDEVIDYMKKNFGIEEDTSITDSQIIEKTDTRETKETEVKKKICQENNNNNNNNDFKDQDKHDTTIDKKKSCDLSMRNIGSKLINHYHEMTYDISESIETYTVENIPEFIGHASYIC
jgi:hypothetical protein